jgi:hypothetical protein
MTPMLAKNRYNRRKSGKAITPFHLRQVNVMIRTHVVLSVLVSVVSCFLLTSRGVGDESRKKAPTTSLVLSCAAVPDNTANAESRDVRFFALFSEDDANKLTWDVTVNEKARSVLISGMLQAKVQWELTEANQVELDSLLKQVRTNQYHPMLVLAEVCGALSANQRIGRVNNGSSSFVR